VRRALDAAGRWRGAFPGRLLREVQRRQSWVLRRRLLWRAGRRWRALVGRQGRILSSWSSLLDATFLFHHPPPLSGTHPPRSAAPPPSGRPAVADPVNSHGKAVKPKIFDIVGVGSNTTEYLLGQLSVDYNAAHGKKHNATHPWIYSWDAVPPGNPTNQTSRIIPKSGCPRVARPAGSGAGVTTLFDNTKSSHRYCVDFARSSSYRSSGQPIFGLGGSAFVVLAKDAVTSAGLRSPLGPA
jgi:hypothetical protein